MSSSASASSARSATSGSSRRAAALHVNDVDLAPEAVVRARLHGDVAAAVQHQVGLGADQARAVHAQRDVIPHRRVQPANPSSLRVAPAALHGA
jgi:hypothetical protein